MTVDFRIAADTHPGMKRAYNQDSVKAEVVRLSTGSVLALLIVADGVGGQKAGEIASKMAVDTIYGRLEDLLNGGESLRTTQPINRALLPGAEHNRLVRYLQARLEDAIQEANHNIRQYAGANAEAAGNMRSTVTCALIHDGLALIGNVGDSRTYIYSDGHLEQVTEDHSYVGQLVRDGQIDKDDVFSHPRRNVITRALGNRETVDVDIWQRFVAPGDILLLCSDGLWEMVTDESDMVAVLAHAPNLETAVQQLITAANAAGGQDNIGIVLAEMTGTGTGDLVDPTGKADTTLIEGNAADPMADTLIDPGPVDS